MLFRSQIPLIGSLLSRETEEIQKSNIVLALDCQTFTPVEFTEIIGYNGSAYTTIANLDGKSVPATIPDVDFKRLQARQSIDEKTAGHIKMCVDDTRNIKEKGMGSMNHWGFGQWLIDSGDAPNNFKTVETPEDMKAK